MKKKSAFTMIELVMVIVVLGIIAAMAMPRMESDIRQEASDNLYAAVQLARHMALIDNKTDPNDFNWQKELWNIRFFDNGAFYTISSNTNQDNTVDKTETAIDPSNGKYMYNLSGDTTIDSDESASIFIGNKYGVNSVTFTGGCAGPYIAFDHLGRPFSGGLYSSTTVNIVPFANIMNDDCNITIGFTDTTKAAIVLTIRKETGYISIQ